MGSLKHLFETQPIEQKGDGEHFFGDEPDRGAKEGRGGVVGGVRPIDGYDGIDDLSVSEVMIAFSFPCAIHGFLN